MQITNPWLRLPLFALLLLIPVVAGEIYVRSLPDPAKSKHKFLLQHSNEIDVLILGSSHTYYGICPEDISPNAYSAAQVSQTLCYDNWILHHYPFGRLQTVILPISDFSFYEELEQGNEWYLANRYRLYMECDLHSQWSVYNWEVTAFRVFCNKLQSLWKSPSRQWSTYGQGLEYTLAKRPATWDNGAERAATNHDTNYNATFNNERYLQSMAAFCKERGIKLLLISTPLRPSYRQNQLPKQVKDMHLRIQNLVCSFPQVVYRDYSADPRFEANDFYDSDHLCRQGAHKLSRLLKATIDSLDTLPH